jgi:CBS-domain-containing membrane protein
MEEKNGRAVMNLLGRLRLARLIERFPERVVWAVFVFVNGFITCAILATMAMAWKTTFIFPSLGPTAFMIFFNPTSAMASPRNAVLGHAVGILCGYGALWLTGLQYAEPATVAGVHDPRIVAAAVSLASTGAFMILFNVVHPPAAATTLIISLGIITATAHLLIIELAVAVLALQAIVVNRLAGVDYPIWAKRIATSETRR